ncbi:MAG: YmdB family metallophosphoesterase [candidate division Zixibacteria bacterium]|nr:YmdB family metallophosphoesterase [candidate division Zixibacteria bacterium]NIS45148.1 YmdB family metallophosphoesterase [candidate division Zixibacteria bacterium]NIU13308.1 YmdB family metallophosphoesterase [candidate division Zixibacteria bacterium]
MASGPAVFSAVIVDINEDTGKAESIQRLQLTHP